MIRNSPIPLPSVEEDFSLLSYLSLIERSCWTPEGSFRARLRPVRYECVFGTGRNAERVEFSADFGLFYGDLSYLTETLTELVPDQPWKFLSLWRIREPELRIEALDPTENYSIRGLIRVRSHEPLPHVSKTEAARIRRANNRARREAIASGEIRELRR